MPSAKLTRGVLFRWLFPPCFLAFETCAAAQLSIESQIGFHGLFQLGRSFPLRVIVGNTGPPATGTVEITVWKRSAPQGTDFYPLRYRRELVLPANARKSALFAVDPDLLSRPLEIHLSSAGERIVRQVDLRRHFSPMPLILAVTGRAIAPLSLPAGLKNPVVPLTLSELPAEARSYGGVLAVVFYEQSLRNLSGAQSAALESWLLSGGRLVVLASLHYALYQEAAMSRLLPVKVKGLRRLPSAPRLESAYGDGAGALKDLWAQDAELVDGEVLLSEGKTPILVRQRRGKGEMVYLALDAGRPPLSRWAGLGPLFGDLLRPRTAVESAGGAVWDSSVVVPLLSSVYFSRASPAPFFFWAALYLAGGGIWIFFWLRLRTRRRALVFSLFLFLASVSAAGYFHLDRSGGLPDGVLLSARLYEGLSGGYADIQSNLALFSSRARSYDIAVESGWSDFEMRPSPANGAQGEPVLLQDELDGIRFHVPLAAWDYRLFRLRSVRRFPIQAEARRRGNTFVVTLANQSRSRIDDCWLLLFGEPFHWGSLSPGAAEERAFRLDSGEGKTRKASWGEIRFDDQGREILFRHSFFPGVRSAEQWSGRALFFGWVQEELREARLENEHVLPYRYALYRAAIPWTGDGEEE